MQFRSLIIILGKCMDGHTMESDFGDPFITALNCRYVTIIVTYSNLSTDCIIFIEFKLDVLTLVMFVMVDLQTVCRSGTRF
jgi:hypothetical protein